jgi:hypothetical protein
MVGTYVFYTCIKGLVLQIVWKFNVIWKLQNKNIRKIIYEYFLRNPVWFH